MMPAYQSSLLGRDHYIKYKIINKANKANLDKQYTKCDAERCCMNI